MMQKKAYAKINLSLDITGNLPNGYHEILTVFQSIDLYDTVSVELTDSKKTEISCDKYYIPNDNRNIAYKCSEAFFTASGIENRGVQIIINKIIPVGAGLGGGSADGAAVLSLLNNAYGCPLTQTELEKAGDSVGADIPFCIRGGTALGKGKGNLLTDISPLPDCFIVVAKPHFSISTPELFSELDRRKIRLHPDTKGLLQSIEKQNLTDISRRTYNVFEEVLGKRKPAIEEIKNKMQYFGCLGCAMTGTGSAVFGIYDKLDMAQAALDAFRSEKMKSYLTHPLTPEKEKYA